MLKVFVFGKCDFRVLRRFLLLALVLNNLVLEGFLTGILCSFRLWLTCFIGPECVEWACRLDVRHDGYGTVLLKVLCMR